MRPNPKIAIPGLVLVALLGVFLAGGYERGTAAPPPSPDENESYLLDQGAGISLPALDSAVDAQPTPDTASRALSFISAWMTPLLEPGGWLHLKDQVERDGLYLGEFPDGRPIPEDYVFDTWHLIGDGGLAVKSVNVMYDLAGRQVQISVFDGHTWRNPTFGITYPGEPSALSLDNGLSYTIRRGQVTGVEWTSSSRSGRPTVEIAIHEDIPGGVALEGYPERLSRITHRGIFDAQTNQLLSFEILFTSENGEERVVSVSTTLVAERVDRPPDAVLALLEEYSQ